MKQRVDMRQMAKTAQC